MAFDAGSVEAKLILDPSPFDRTLADREAKVKAFEDDPHRVKLLADLDTSSLGKARKAFTDLDNAISKDAMNRLRSSPQGSVLGALNALFSPHPVTGAPSPQQSAQQGLLGKMLSVPGGGNAAPSGNSGSSSGSNGGNGTTVGSLLSNAPGDTSSTDDVVQKLTGSAPGNVSTTDDIKQALTGTGAQDVTTTDDIKQLLTGTGAGNVSTTDTIKQLLTGQGAANATTTDTINQKLAGTGATDTSTTDTINQKLAGTGAKDTVTTDTVKEQLDQTSVAKTQGEASASGGRAGVSWASMFASHLQSLLPASATDSAEKAAKSSGDSSGASFFSGFSSRLGPFFAGFVKGAKKAGSDGGSALDTGLLGGIGPGILGISTKLSGIVGLVGSALGALPALLGIIGTGMGVAMVGGLLAAAVKGSTQLKAQFTAAGKDFTTVLAQASAPIIPALSAVLNQVPPLVARLRAPLTQVFATIAPQIQGVFSGLAPIIQGVLGMMQAAAPVFGPFIEALESLVGNLLPGVATVIKATVPFVTQFASIMSSLGSNLGSLFATAAPAIQASMQILSGLLNVVAGLLPVVLKLADIFATALGPVFAQFAGVVQSLLPVLLQVGGVIAQFAGAVIGDLASAFGAVASLIKALAPSLAILAADLSGVFTVLENTGVFAVFGDALENLAVPLANLINALVTGLAPVLPVLTAAFSDLVTTAVDVLSVSLGAVLTALTPVVSALATAASAVVGFLQSTGLLVPLMAGLAIAFGPVSKGLLAMAEGLGAFTGSSFVAGIAGIVTGIGDFAAATAGATVAEKALFAAELLMDSVNPLAWVVLGAAALTGLVVLMGSMDGAVGNLTASLARQDNAVGYNISGYQKLAAQLAPMASYFTQLANSGQTYLDQTAAQLTAAEQQAVQMASNLTTRLGTLSGAFGVSKTTIEDWASAAGISAQKFAGSGENVDTLTTAIVNYVNKNPQAVLAASSIGTQIAIFGDSVFSATTNLDAFNSIWNTLVGSLLSKQEAVTNSNSAFDNLASTIKNSGKDSDAAGQSFQQYISQIGSSASTLLQNGASINAVNGYLQGQIDHIKTLGPLNAGEKADLAALKTFQDALANSTKGLTDNQLTWIHQAEQNIIPDLAKMHADTPLVNTDIKNLANSIAQTGTTSASTESDRSKLIADLEATGVQSKTATSLVGGLITKLGQVPKSVASAVTVRLSATGGVDAVVNVPGVAEVQGGGRMILSGSAAAGGKVTDGTGPTADDVLIRVSKGETIVSAATSKEMAPLFSAFGVPGYADGGIAGAVSWVRDHGNTFTSSDGEVFVKSVVAAYEAAAKAAAAAAEAAASSFTASGGASGGIIQAMFKTMAAAKGWTGAQLTALLEVESREAGFNMTATNASSGAYGLAQFIDGPSEYAQYGGNSTTAPGQITAMLNYIQQRYGTPEAAWAHELSDGWYDNGGSLQPGYTLAYNGTGRPEQVTSPAQAMRSQASLDAIASRLDKLISVTSQAPAATGQHVGAAIGGAASAASFRSRFPR